MSHHLNITYPNSITYWIFHSTLNNRYLSGYTDVNQVTSASDEWESYLQTLDIDEWKAACDTLNISYDIPPQFQPQDIPE